MSNRFRIVYLFLLSLTFYALASGQSLKVISYQGVLTDTNGVAKPDGNYNFIFQLYSSATGGTALWTETKSLALRKGLFVTMLGDQTAFPDSVRFDKAYWLNLQVESEVLVPRIRLGAVGYAFYALRADTAKFAFTSVVGASSVVTASIQDGAVTTAKLADNAVTSAKIANDAITSSKIADGSIASSDIAPTFKAPKADTATFALNSVVGNNSVSTSAIQDAAVTGAKIADGTITAVDVTSDFKAPKADTATFALSSEVGSNAIGTSALQDLAVTTVKIAEGAVTDSKIVGLNSSKLSGALPVLNGSALTNVAANTLNSGTHSNQYNFSNSSNIFNGAFTGDGSGLTGISASSVSVNSVDSTNIKDGSITSADVKDGSITDLKVSSGISASKLTGALPGLDGSALTNLSAGNISSGTLDDARLSAAVTKAGNVYNGATQLVQLDGNGKLPGLDGSALTNVNGSSLAAGTYGNQYSFSNALNSFTGSFIGDGSALTNLPTTAPADNSVDSTDIKDGSVATADIRSGAITDEKLAEGISASKLTGPLPALNGSALTNISATSLASGTFANDYTFSSSSNSFAGSGAGLTNLNAANVSTGTVDDARLSTAITKAGNTFNGAYQLVQLTNLGKLPTLDGSALTNVSTNSLTAGTYASQYNFTNSLNSFAGSFTGDGTALTSLNPANLSAVVPVSKGGTGSDTVNFVDLTNSQTITVPKVFAPTTNVTGLTVRKTEAIEELMADPFKVTNADGSTDFFRVTPNGQLWGDGLFLTNLSANNLAFGTIPDGRLVGEYSYALTLSNASNSFTGDGSGLSGLNASNLSSGTVPSDRLVGTYSQQLNLSNLSNAVVCTTLVVGGSTLKVDQGNVGVGTSSPNSTLHVNGSMALKFTSFTGAGPHTAGDESVIFVNTTGASSGVTLNLPDASTVPGRVYRIKWVAGSFSVSVDPDSSQTIDGALTQGLGALNDRITIISDGSNWFILESLLTAF